MHRNLPTICYLCSEYPPVSPIFGGIGIAFQTEAEWFVHQGYEVHVLSLKEDITPEVITHNGVNIHLYPNSRIPKLRGFIDRIVLPWQVRNILKDRMGICVAPDYLGPIIVKPFKQPLVIQLHGCATLNAIQQGLSPRQIIQLLEKRTLGLSNGIRSVSNFTLLETLHVLNISIRKQLVIGNSVGNPIEFLPPLSNIPTTPRILFIGKLNTLKGVFVLAKIILGIFEAFPEATLVLVGQDTIEQGSSVKTQFLQLIPSFLHDRVQIMGRLSRKEVINELFKATLLVLPSLIEAFPMVILEAMMCCKPVIASRRGGIPEIVQDGITGLLADPDNPNEFLAAVIMLLSNPHEAYKMGLNGHQYVLKHYTDRLVYSKIETFYQNLMEENY